MPNAYRYFQSGEISDQRFFLEIELLKKAETNDFDGFQWDEYDTPFLRALVHVGLTHAKEALAEREKDHRDPSKVQQKQIDFIHQCLERHERKSMTNEEMFSRSKSFFPLISNLILAIISLFLLGGYFLSEHPLTARRRHLFFTDDLSLVLLTSTMALTIACVIMATRFNRWILLIGILIAVGLVILGFGKAKRIIGFLSKFREKRWPNLYDSTYS